MPDDLNEVKKKVKLLVDWLLQNRGSCVVHAGAGLSTAAGIPDFRGKKGVWTKHLSNIERSKQQDSAGSTSTLSHVKKEEGEQDTELEGKSVVKPFDETEPTFSHLALKNLCELGYVSHIVSQNVDGLFLKANLRRNFISELHGNFYLDECTRCRYRFVRGTASTTMRLHKSDVKCPRNADMQKEGNPCKGHLRDTILDWESPIPFNELRVATRESKRSKLHICIGTSLQLKPSMDLVCKQNRGKAEANNKLVIINLQPTQFDSCADLVIRYYADDVMRELASLLNLRVPGYERDDDPTKNSVLIGTTWKR